MRCNRVAVGAAGAFSGIHALDARSPIATTNATGRRMRIVTRQLACSRLITSAANASCVGWAAHAQIYVDSAALVDVLGDRGAQDAWGLAAAGVRTWRSAT